MIIITLKIYIITLKMCKINYEIQVWN